MLSADLVQHLGVVADFWNASSLGVDEWVAVGWLVVGILLLINWD